MKNFNEYLKNDGFYNESLVDDFEELNKTAEIGIEDSNFARIINEFPKASESGCDAFGRKLEVGDWVICIPPGSRTDSVLTFGKVKKISPKKISVTVKSNERQINWKSIKKIIAARNSPVMDVLLFPEYIFKITNKNDFLKTLNI